TTNASTKAIEEKDARILAELSLKYNTAQLIEFLQKQKDYDIIVRKLVPATRNLELSPGGNDDLENEAAKTQANNASTTDDPTAQEVHDNIEDQKNKETKADKNRDTRNKEEGDLYVEDEGESPRILGKDIRISRPSKSFEKFTLHASQIEFIEINLLKTKPKEYEKRIFLCLVLGRYLDWRQQESLGRLKLPKNGFPIAQIIDTLENFQPDTFPEEYHLFLSITMTA
ncbi:9442_t:CDS:2, partial [Funneliformis geosporum]